MEREKLSTLDIKSLPEPGSKYKLGLKIGGGVGSEVYEAVESQTGRKVAIKVTDLTKESEEEIKQEYRVLKFLCPHENFPKFYGIYLKKGKDNVQRIWLVIELCEGGTATDLTRKVKHENKKMSELHIAYILKETIKAVIYLHENKIVHRDVRGSNIMLTSDGKVKLIDFGISRYVDNDKKIKTSVGSPSWMAPEMITSQHEDDTLGYDQKVDVWALGITAIELGDGQAPFEDMHPGRALSQIVQNPPPTLHKPSNWSQVYNDFVSECLVKIPENRPYIQELLAHTFFEPLDNEENLEIGLNALLEGLKDITLYKKPEIQVRNGYMKNELLSTSEKILQEDLAALTDVSEDSVLEELHERLKKNEFHTFVGDILLILNPNININLYGNSFHNKYRFKAKSQNSPHIYAVADSAYRDVFHHEKPQHILFSGETGAGKTVNMMHTIDHLIFLGQGLKSSMKVKKALAIIHALGNAATPHNSNSTRHILQIKLTFTDTGKVSGAVFRIHQLEKERVTRINKKQANFHLVYYFYDAIKSKNNLKEFHLDYEEHYKFLQADSKKTFEQNVLEYESFENNLRDFGFEEKQLTSIKKILAAILLIGEIEFVDDEDGNGALTSVEVVKNVANLLGVEKKKLSWALLNYCVIMKGEATMRQNSKAEADEAKYVLARGLYSRMVDWIVNKINENLSIPRVIFGERHIINLLDIYGFECYKRNTLDQLFVNTANEQLQFHYNQKIFIWDKQTAEEEGILVPTIDFNDNKTVIDLIMSKPEGLLQKIDQATRNGDSSYIIESLKNAKTASNSLITAETTREFSINHYTGKLMYDASEMQEKNRDFLPPELIETMRLSTQEVTKQLFSCLLTKSGNLSTQSHLTVKQTDDSAPNESDKNKNKEKKFDTNPFGQYSQSRQMRTAATTFRDTCFHILKNLTISELGFHFVRCIRINLSGKPNEFQPEIVRQQLRALAVVNTIITTQQGYSYSVSHNEFIRRYKFLAFDFDENVEENKENCRLLLLRLKLEGWAMGKTKVFLKYFNKEYLSRLYETQIKKIVKVQTMIRAFMARRKLYAKIRKYQADADKDKYIAEEEKKCLMRYSEAASIIQKKFRKYAINNKNKLSPTIIADNLSETQKAFIWPWFKRWKRRSIFQVLLLYRATTMQTLVNFCLQVHIYNQNTLSNIKRINYEVHLEVLNLEAEPNNFLPPVKCSVYKLPFNWNDLNLCGNVTKCEPFLNNSLELMESEAVARIQQRIKKNINMENSAKNMTRISEDKETQTCFYDSNSTLEQELQVDKVQNDLHPSPKTICKNEELINTTPTNPFQSDETINSNESTNLEIKFVQNEFLKKLTCKTQKHLNTKNYITRMQEVYYHPHTVPQVKSHQIINTPLMELKEKFLQTNNIENNDEPPFNFKAMLRKTNFSTSSDTNVHENVISQQNVNNFDLLEKRKSLKAIRNNEKVKFKVDVTELAPGILVYGQIADL